ncbi:MAG: hypothetical protein C4K49_08465 [Candidatus Thorarchaeota archaeon]|nr:MAG: hypothetical protein C4K49_08465 [Candidatus Thorarchaeota archaeon]
MSETRRGSWKDSNWYVSMSGFFREYRKHRIGVFGIILMFFFLVMAVGAPWIATNDPSPGATIAPTFMAPVWMQVFDPNAVVSKEYMTDPYLADAPVFEYRGSPDEFSYAHHASTGSSDPSYVNLTWTHEAYHPLDFVVPPIPLSDMPDCRDFVFFNKTLEWTPEKMPNDVNITIEFSMTTTGNFSTNENGGLMFKLYIWLIDSSGNWKMVYKSFPPYSSVTQSRNIDLSWFDILAGWGGMVPDPVTGAQPEDPTDLLTIGVGLAPTKEFRYFGGEFPWRTYNGSVTAKVSKLSVFCYGNYYGLLGTTDKGADAWSQLIYGSRVSLTIGVLATALSTVVGVIVGLVAGYFGGKVDEVLMRVVDFLLVIPGLPLMMVLAAFLGPTVENIIIVIAILGWTGTSRLIRSQVMAEKNKAYVESARAIGASDTYIIFRHVLPNVTPILFANITLGVVGAILSESGLAFLGLTDPSKPSWGRMLADAQGSGGFSNGAWWVVVFPGLMITSLSLAFTFVGHTLDQVLNPRLRER